MSFGHFTGDGREYVITDAMLPPRAQINFLWNDTIISGVNQFGSGEGIFNNQTLTYNHPEGRVRMIRDGRRYFYLRDAESGEYWNAGFYPAKKAGAEYQATVGLGYSKYRMVYEGIECLSRVFVSPDEPVEIWEFEITNRSTPQRRIELVPYVEWLLGGYGTFSSPYSYLRSRYDEKQNAVLSYNTSDERPHGRYNAFVATDGAVSQWCGGRRDFLGPFGEISRPRCLEEGAMSCREAWCEELAGAMMICCSLLSSGGMQTITVILGSFDTEEEKDRLIGKVLREEYRRGAWEKLKSEKEAMLERVWVETPDEKINRMVNIWAKQQIQLCAEFGRDGARGFRDTLQDAWGILPFHAKLGREKILETLAHQCSDGHGIRGWLPLQMHHYSDGPAWITPAVTAYLKETGDFDFLKERIVYLDEGQDTVLGHMLRGVRHLSEDTGVHGLVLAHEGDWNDSLNWMGRGGKGESVWTSMALYYSLNLLKELAEDVLKDVSLVQEVQERAERIRQAIWTHGWDGQWYLAGYSDAGNPVGSQKNQQGKVFLNPQTWAILTGLTDAERFAACTRAIDEILDSRHGSLVLWPTYTRRDENVGRVTMLLPGMYENGTPYCHGTAFKIVADLCCAGRADKALQSYYKVLPDSDDHPSTVSGCEPYAFTNQYLGPDNARAGESISGWITGTAAWMFRAAAEYFCGVKPGYYGFRVQPNLPTAWKRVNIRRTLRGRDYRIEIERSGDGYAIRINQQVMQTQNILYEE